MTMVTATRGIVSAEVERELLKLSRDVAKAWLRIAEILYQAKKGTAQRPVQTRPFLSWAGKILGIGERKVYNLLKIYKAFVLDLHLVSEVVEIGWSKASLLATFINKENARRLCTFAVEHSYEDVYRMRYRELRLTERLRKPYSVCLLPKQVDVLERALSEIKNATGLKKRGDLLAGLALAYLENL